MKVVLKSDLTCPRCGHVQSALMPIDSRTTHFTCEGCRETIVVQEEACCVYCAFGSVGCPPAQINGPCADKLH